LQVFLVVTVPARGGLLIPVYGSSLVPQFPDPASSNDTCPTCRTQVLADWRFCSQCGNRLRCSNCATPVSKDGKFCPECGNPTN